MRSFLLSSASRTPGEAPWLVADALKKNNIDFVRFTLATLVIFAHSFALPIGDDSTEPLYRFSHGQRTFGGMAVDFFFILSGFLITHSWLRSGGLLSFLWNRVLRIYPAFIAAVLLGVFVIVPLFSGIGPGFVSSLRIDRLLWGLLLLRDVDVAGFPHNPIHAINGSLWSIQYEFWCYIGVAVLGLLTILARRPAWMLPLFVLSVIGSTVYEILDLRLGGGFVGHIVGSPATWARLLPCFLSGMIFYLFRDRIPWHPGLLLGAIAMLVVACRIDHAMSIASPIAGTYVLFSVAFGRVIKLHRFGKFGDFSYGMYAYAFPIQQALVANMGTDVSVWWLFVCSFGLTLVVAIVSWFAIESPFLRLKKRGPAVATSKS